MTQLEIHKKIDSFFKVGVGSADIDVAKSLIATGDGKRYFFTKADASWINWFWENGFLDNIKQKSENPHQYSFLMPELDYLSKVATEKEDKIVEIINSVGMSEKNFNPEVIMRFLWIMRSLEADKIKDLTEKVKNDNWVYLMRDFRKSGYEFKDIINKLKEGKQYKALLEFAEAILIIKKEVVLGVSQYGDDDPFYITDLDASDIFEALADIGEEYQEQALKFTTEKLGEIIKAGGKDKTDVFEYRDLFSLLDVDIFTLKVEESGGRSYRQDAKNLLATIKELTEKTIKNNCADIEKVKKMFGYINDLPDCRLAWRLRLFAMAQCPEAFKEELKKAFFRVFIDEYWQIENGTEYKKTLEATFDVLSETDRQQYIDRVFQFFSEKDKEKENEKEVWHKRTAWEILSVISKKNLLGEEDQNKCEKVFDKKPEETYEPEPSIGKIRGGTVIDRSPVELKSFSVDKIAESLKSEWTADKIKELSKDDDFLNPRSINGLGEALKEDFKERVGDYLGSISLFFDREKMHPHYVYSILRGVDEMMRNKQLLTPQQIKQLFDFFATIKKSGLEKPFERKDSKDWFADWITVHKIIADILLYLTENKEIRKDLHREYKPFIQEYISYLLIIKQSPSPEEEKPEYGELYTVAINSVRGRAFELLVVFTENNGEKLDKETKAIFQKALEDSSLAVRFVIGRYLAVFYFRDKEFVKGLFSAIFPKEKKDIYLATWEGYLSNSLYGNLFDELKDYYIYAINFNPEEYTKRKYYKGLDEALAIHLSLAFIYLNLKIGDPLFEEFWEIKNIKRQKEFIHFIGQKCFSRDNYEYGEEDKFDRKKMIKFWDWALSKKLDPEILSGFGFWINPNKEILEDKVAVEKISETLKQSNGAIDWDYGLVRRLNNFAVIDKNKTLDIIKNYLLDNKENLNPNRTVPMFSVDQEIKEALKIIYDNSEKGIKEKVRSLIDLLIERGSSMFWGLKDVLKED